MRATIVSFLFVSLTFFSCNKDTDIPIPTAGPNSLLAETYPLKDSSKRLMEGIYRVTSGADFFGDQIVLKWNRGSLSFACSNGKYFVMQAGQLDSVIILQGYWRNGYNDGTGLTSCYISREEGGRLIVTGSVNQQIKIRGAYGIQSGLPDQSLTLEFLRPFSEKVMNSNFYILAHRSGGRTSDRLPVSENSIEMINYTEKFGSTGIEIDVRLSKDGVPFIYHDPDINIRLTKKCPLAGPIENYTWSQLSAFVRLIHGEKIPTLEEALVFTIDSTLLRFVYLDMKANKDAMGKVIPIQKRMLQRAIDKGRDLMIVVGIPSSDVLNDLMSYPDYQNIPSLCELSVEDVRQVNALVWSPRWTLGTQNELVQQMHEEGRLAVTWTIDGIPWIREYIQNGNFDGMLTNFPYVVAYYHYIQE